MGDAKIRTDRTDSVTEAICNRTNPNAPTVLANATFYSVMWSVIAIQ